LYGIVKVRGNSLAAPRVARQQRVPSGLPVLQTDMVSLHFTMSPFPVFLAAKILLLAVIMIFYAFIII
jgi:hypothetical protein